MTRLFLKIVGLLLLANFLVVAGGYGLIKWLEREQLLISPHQAPQILAEHVLDAWESGDIHHYAHTLGEHGTAFALLDEDREPLFVMPALRRFLKKRPALLPPPVPRHHQRGHDHKHRMIKRAQFTITISNTHGDLFYVITRSRHPLHSLLPQPTWRRYVPWVAVALTMILASSLISFYITRPIRSLRHTTQSFGQWDLSARVEPKVAERQDAIGELGRDFNRMAQRLDDTLRSQHQLLRDISHELRSPLARIQVASTLAEQKAGASSELQRIDLETQRLDSLIEAILRLTRLNDMPDLVFESLDMTHLIQEVARDARYEYQNTDKKIALDLGMIPNISADYEHLSSALENIVRNAMYYTSDASTVHISAHATDTRLEISVTDAGPGVPEEDLQRLFEPFFRSDTSRNEKTGSNGVGLAITHRIIELHAGQVAARNAKAGGLIITIHLPLLRKGNE